MAKRLKMRDWRIEFTYDASPSNRETEELFDRVESALEQCDGVAGNGPDGFTIAVYVRERSADAALDQARGLVAGLVDFDVVGIDVLHEPIFIRRSEIPSYPEIVSAVEAAEMLGVSRQRVHQLYADNEQFPTALYHLKTGPLWVKGTIEHFAKVWERKPGRPKKTA